MQSRLEYALAYAKLDWLVFPCWWVNDDHSCGCGSVHCKNIGKHPIAALAPKGQLSATKDTAVITDWWTKHPNANIAIYLAGSGLCAVDIDPRNGGDFTIEELEQLHGNIDSNVLQLTGGGGEHRVFFVPDGAEKLPGKLGRGVDMKHNGYIIAAPSNHVSGNVYTWEMSCDPLDGAVPSPLPDWIRSHNPNAAYTSQETGSLHHGMTDEQYSDVLEALGFIDSDERDTWLSVGMALQATGDSRAFGLWRDWSATSAKFDPQDQYRVWQSFKGKGLGSIDLPTLFKLAQDAGWINARKNAPTMAVAEAFDEVNLSEKLSKKYNTQSVPRELLSLPVPILNDLATWVEGYSREPQRQITIQTVVAIISVLCGRIYQSTEANTSSLYLLTLGDTGVGKNYAKTAIQAFLVQTDNQALLSGSGNTSSGAVFSAMIESPCHIQIMDEIGKHLQTARKQQNGQMAEAFSTLVEAYSATTSLMMPKNYSNMGRRKSERVSKQEQLVHSPAVTILGLATPAQVYENLSTVEIEDGFLNRLVVVEISEPQAPKQRSRREPLPDHLLAWADAIRHPKAHSRTALAGIDTDHSMPPACIDVVFDDDALTMFDDFYDTLREQEAAGAFVLPDMTRRWNENAMRLATALAVCANPDAPVITVELAGWALQYVTYYGKCFMEAVATKVADSEFHRLYLTTIDYIRRAGAPGITERDLSKYCRRFAASTPVQRDQVLEALKRENLAQQVSISSQSGRGRKRVAWIAEEFLDDE